VRNQLRRDLAMQQASAGRQSYRIIRFQDAGRATPFDNRSNDFFERHTESLRELLRRETFQHAQPRR
jgi:hypothetical protein